MSKKAEKVAEEETKEVAKKEPTTVVPAGDDIDFDASAGAGSENMGADDLAIPRINIIQSLSPQRSKTKPEFIEGAEEGVIFDNVTKELFDGGEGITVVPIQFIKSYIEWAPRASGQGMVKHHGSDSSAYDAIEPNDKFQRINKEGNEIIPTAEYFVYLVDKNGSFSPYVLSMSKSALKHAKRWNSMINKLTVPHPKDADKMWDAPIFWGVYKLTTVPESNQQGEWFRWEITPEGTIDELASKWDIYKAAEKFRASINKGEVKVHAPEDDGGSPASETDDDPM